LEGAADDLGRVAVGPNGAFIGQVQVDERIGLPAAAAVGRQPAQVPQAVGQREDGQQGVEAGQQIQGSDTGVALDYRRVEMVCVALGHG